jgi:type I restriction enzyme R subunit
LDIRQQEDAVDKAMMLFSGTKVEAAKEIWLVDAAPKVIVAYEAAVANLNQFMEAQGLDCTPSDVNNLKGDAARAEFINSFKEVQRLKTQLDQYTDLEEAQTETIEKVLSTDDLRSFKSVYLDTAKRLKALQDKVDKNTPEEVQQLDFEFVLFSSAVIDYDYIMGLIAKYTSGKPSKEKMTREQLINLLSSSANLMEEREDIIAYINSLAIGKSISETDISKGYEKFKAEKSAQELRDIAEKYGIEAQRLKEFVDAILYRMIFDGEKLSDLLAPLDLGWKDRTKVELALMEDLVPLLNKRAQGREIAGLNAYE